MKSRIFKKFMAIALASVLVVAIALPASAENSTTLYSSPESTAGSYTTGGIHSLNSSLASPYGGDAGIWFYEQSTGLQASFYRTNSRKSFMELWEDDGIFSGDDQARKYEATFATVNGLYRPYYYSTTYTAPGGLEGDSGLELYIKFMIGTNSNDTSQSVPGGILLYKFWTY